MTFKTIAGIGLGGLPAAGTGVMQKWCLRISIAGIRRGSVEQERV